MAMTNIYILRLAGGNYYVGKSADPMARYEKHLTGRGSAWTCAHRPVAVERIIRGASAFDEDRYTKEYMAKYGIDKVRGGTYVSLSLSVAQRTALQQEIRGATDSCTKCGNKGHFAANCTQGCGRCGRISHTTRNCHAMMAAWSDEEEAYGREGHNSNKCYARTHVWDTDSDSDSDSD